MQEIKSARSLQNGIIFCSNVIPIIGVEIYYDKYGEMKIKKQSSGIWMPEDLKEQKELYFKGRLLGIALCIFALITAKISIVYGALYMAFFGAVYLMTLLNYICKFRIPDKNGMTIAKFHAAEHKAINAYNRIGRIPTIEEIRNETWISDCCGSIQVIRRSINSLIVFGFNIIPAILSSNGLDLVLQVPILSTIGVLAAFFFYKEVKKNLYKYLEILYLQKPTDKELLLAQKGLEEFEKMENMLKSNPNQFLKELQIQIIPNEEWKSS